MPIGFRIRVNGGTPILAGADAATVLTAVVSWAASGNAVELSVGGLSDDGSRREDLAWLQRELTVGDCVELTVIQEPGFDPPAHRNVEDPAFVEQQERQYYEQLKARFEPRRD